MSEPEISLGNFGEVGWGESQALYHVQAHLGLPALNILWPREPYVCIGRFQDLDLDVDAEACRQRGLPLVRREVGGGAVLLDSRQVFYQLVLPEEWLGATPDYRRLFRLGLDGVVLAQKRLGVNAAVRGANDGVVGSRKISGNGAGLVGRSAVVVGNILLDFDHETMASVLKVPDEKFRDKVHRSMKDNLVSLAELAPGAGNEPVARLLEEAMAEILSGVRGWGTLSGPVRVAREDALPAAVTEALPSMAAHLTDPGWLQAVRRDRERRTLRIRQGLEMRENLWKAPGGLLRCHCAFEEGRLTWLSFSGDVFAHPPRALEMLEQALLRRRPEEIREAAARFLAREDVSLPGVGPEDIERAVLGRTV